MISLPTVLRTLSRVGLLAGVLTACTDRGPDAVTGLATTPSLAVAPAQDIAAAIAAQRRHTAAMLRIPGVVGTAVGVMPNGRVGIQILLANAGIPGLPAALDGIPVAAKVTGLLMARSDPTTKQRPAPVGFSVGHPLITAGTIGARVVNATGNVYVLSNNHVLANSNDANLGDPTWQPGPFDGGVAADQIGTLAAFKPIDFSGGNNTIDAAIALSNTNDLSNATPADDGYGLPNAQIWGDANNDRIFDNKNALLNLAVMKYGRTTKLTHGTITGINATLNICYEVFIIFCVKSATFVDQIIIEPGAFSGGGDSGSLIVTDDANRNPVALLFAGSSTQTIGNRIDLVLNHFGVTVDGTASPPPPPPTPITDLAVLSVTGPSSITVGNSANYVVTIKNVGTENVPSTFDVTLRDATANVVIGTQSVAGLNAGLSTTRTFVWNTTGSSIGSHTLTSNHTFADENSSNDQASTIVAVNPPSIGMHVGNLTSLVSSGSTSWSATVEIAVHDANHNPLNGATVVGTWVPTGLNSNTCTSGDLGGNGTCIVLFPSIRRNRPSVTFTVNSLAKTGYTYASGSNHDVDGGSNGTSIKVNRP